MADVLKHPSLLRGRAGAVTASDVNRLARHAFEQRFVDHDAMFDLAHQAERLSHGLPRTRRGYQARAKAAGVLGNCHRIRGDYPDARALLDRAVEFRERGGSSRRCLGYFLSELRASFYEAVRELELARAELSAAETYRRLEGRDLGKVWVQRGLVEMHDGNAEAALCYLSRALNETRHLDIAQHALLSTTWCLTEVRNWRLAEELLRNSSRLFRRAPVGVMRRFPWHHARCADLRDSVDAARTLYSEALASFVGAAMPQEASTILIDMSILDHRTGRWGDSLEKAVQAGRLLAHVPGSPEARASHLLIHASAARLATTLEEVVASLFPLRATRRQTLLS